MKFKGKKAIMAAALSAIVAANSFGTAITASASAPPIPISTLYLGGNSCSKCGNDYLGDGDVSWSGTTIHVTATPKPGAKIYCIFADILVRDTTTGVLSRASRPLDVTPDSTGAYSTLFSVPAQYTQMDNVSMQITFMFTCLHTNPKPEPKPDPTPTPIPDPTPTPNPSPTWKRGDVNLDGYVNAKDATAVLKHVVGLEKLTGQSLINADVNGDGYINAKDATEILKIVVGLV